MENLEIVHFTITVLLWYVERRQFNPYEFYRIRSFSDLKPTVTCLLFVNIFKGPFLLNIQAYLNLISNDPSGKGNKKVHIFGPNHMTKTAAISI